MNLDGEKIYIFIFITFTQSLAFPSIMNTDQKTHKY